MMNYCKKVLDVDGQQYSYCSKQQGLNQHYINSQLSIMQNSANIFINTKYTKQTIVKLEVFSINIFAVFGFSDNNHVIEGGLINVSLNINVSQAALVCMQCQLSISNSQLVFIASGQVLSAVALQVHQEIQLLNTLVQYRFQSLQAAGIVSIISESIFTSLVNVKLNGYNSEQSQNSGYFVSKLTTSTLFNIANFQVCANEDNAIGSGIENLQLDGDILSNCQSSCYSGSFYSYGICVQQLQHGEMIDNTFVCIDPFEFDGQIAQCVCRNGYILNISYCIPIVISITNLDTTMHDLNSQTNMVIKQQKQYLEQMINGNISLLDQYLGNNVSILNATISQELEDVESNLINNVSMIQSYLKNNISDVQTMMASNRSMVESQVANNISQLQDKIYQNITDLNNTVQLEIQQVGQSTTQIASDLLALKSNVQQIVVDQNINNVNQQTQISALNFDVQSLQSSQLQLQSDLVYSNSSLNTQIQSLNTQASHIDTKVVALASQTTNQYNQQQAELSNLDQNLVHNISTLNSTIQVQVQALNTADSALSNSLSALQSQFSSFISTSTLNNTNQQNQIDSLQSTVSTQQSQQQQLSSDISLINTTLSIQANSIQSQANTISSSITSLDSKFSSLFNSQQSQLTTLNSNLIQTNTNLNSLNTTIQQLTFTSQINQEAVYRSSNDSSIVSQINNAVSENTNTNALIQAVQAAIQKQINDFNAFADATYATKAQLV
ncbi:Conserved_hypothetical protein [Hexamita inflata]|uniref:Uncharacterized protein n=1 Tax=Hexamita inflata TaxID=28002 RepID=A0AA86TT69_9EUKA|nr:Conserved hypothetical protein [Hexamita inflata]